MMAQLTAEIFSWVMSSVSCMFSWMDTYWFFTLATLSDWTDFVWL